MAQTHIQTYAATQPALAWLPASRAARFALAVTAGSALLAISAHVSIPLFFTPIPITLQTLAVLLLGLLLDPVVSFATLVAYLAEGAAGLPVFSPQGPVGILHLLGPAGGYLLAYPFAAFLVGKLRRSLPQTFACAAISAAVGSVVYFTGGAAWLAVAAHLGASTALKLAVWPFLAGDALKVVLAAAIVTGLTRIWSRQSKAQHTEPAR
jgi:biotin transport system substrate-specific component